jgi:SAM-dependent methyltransferase
VGGEEQNVERTMRGYYDLARSALRGRERMLDIGCDVGLLLDAGRRDGFQELYGIEPVGVAAAQAAALPDAHISTRFYEDEDYPDEYFDLITLIHVVDHLVDPIVTLERAWKQLKPGGVILAVVHDGGSLLARVLGERFPPYNLYHHYFFERRDLRRLFRRAKFEVLRTPLTYNCYSFGFLVQKVPGLPLKGLARHGLDTVGIGKLPITLPLGNIGIIARRPLVAAPAVPGGAGLVAGPA